MTLLGRPAAAEDRADIARAKESFKAGAAAYAAGEYLAAIQALDAAYALTPLPAIAFSLAQAERKQYFVAREREHLERAIALFRRYVEQVPSGGRLADALDALAQLEPLAAKQESQSLRREPLRETARSTRLMISSDAPQARVSLDGGPPGPSPLIREVEPGKHRVSVEAAGFYPSRREITAVAGELIAVSVPLRERPSTLGLWTADDAEIYIDGVFVSTGGEGVVLHLSSGFHDLAVASKGHRVATRQLRLGRGSSESLRVTLEPTRLRLASKVMFISGGASLGASLVLGALAIRAENRTEDFLAKRKRQNVTEAELFAYNSAIGNRDRYRTAATLSAAAAVGLFITGLFLHELDEPRPQQVYRRTRRAKPSTAAAGEPRVKSGYSLSPLLSPSNYGALVEGTF
jgi:hypothetical protein